MRRKLRHLAGTIESTDMPLVLAVVGMLLYGVVMVYGAGSFNRHAATPVGSYYLIAKHLVMIGVGLLVAGVLFRVDYHRFGHPGVAWILVAVSYFLVAMTLVTGGDRAINRWINIMGFSVQPVEVAKIALIMFVAGRVTVERGRPQPTAKAALLALGCGVLPLLLLLVAQPNFGNAMVTVGMTVIILAVSDLSPRIRWSALLLPPATVILIILVSGKVRERLGAVLKGLQEGSYQYQVKASLTGLGAGGWHGLGVGQSHNKFAFLPEAHTDFIYSLLGEEFGLLGTIPVIILLCLLLWRGYGIANRAADSFGRCVAAGLTTGLAIYGLTNIAMVTGIFPVVGVPLPFISYGGTAMVGCLAAVGILLGIERHSRSYHLWRRRWERNGAQ